MADPSTTPYNRRKEFLHASVIALVVTFLCALGARFLAPSRIAENWVYDLRVAALTPAMPQSKEIVIVAITEDTLATLPYRSPLDRRFLSNLLRTLEQKGARMIGMDILFDQPTETEKDAELRATLRSLAIPVIVVWVDAEAGLTERQFAFMANYLENTRHGLAYVTKDSVDGIVRSIFLGKRQGNQRVLGLAAALANLADVKVPDAATIPLDYRGQPDVDTPAFITYPAHTVSLLPSSWFAGKIVLIGVDLALSDRHRTPFAATKGPIAGAIPGVVLHAQALSQLLDGRKGKRLAKWQEILLILLLATAGVLIAIVDIPATLKAAVGILTIVLAWVAGFVLYQQGGPLVPLVVPTIAFTASGGLFTAHRWRQERAQKRFIRRAFSKFLAPAVIAQLEADPKRLALGGEKREITFMFTDIAGFTTLTEHIEPTILVPLLNAYFDEACEIVLRHGGTIDKFVGDALHVMFNAPGDQPDHAERAVRCAMELDRFCQSFRSQQATRGITFGATRIGVNTGPAIVGNFGGKEHFDYTAHGDTINTAARLESVNKHLGTRICIGAATADKCNDIVFRPVGRLVLKGKTEPIEVLEPLSDVEAASPKTAEYIEAYRLMESSNPETAHAFDDLAKKYPDDRLIAFHARRLESGQTGRTIVMTEK